MEKNLYGMANFDKPKKKRTIYALIALFNFVSILANTAFFSNRVQASTEGLKVNVHVNGAGQVCVSSAVEDLGCKTSTGAGIVNFQFNDEEAVKVGDQFTVCFEGNCVTGINGPEREPEEIFITAQTRAPSAGWMLTVNMVNPPNGINNFYVHVLSPSGFNDTFSDLWTNNLVNNDPTRAQLVVAIPPNEISSGETFLVCVNYDFAGSDIVSIPCRQLTHSNNGNMEVTIRLT
jgi:hypothetical protein